MTGTRRDDPRSWPVETVMSKDPVSVQLDADVWVALRTLLSTGLRHLVVVDADGRYCGVLNDRQVLASWPGDAMGLRSTHVRELVGAPVPSLTLAATVSGTAELMLRSGAGALAVVDPYGRPCGIVTGSDLVRSLMTGTEVAGVGPAAVPEVGPDALPDALPAARL